jgi:hypothetical protein
MDLVERNPEEYVRVYIHGEKMRFGPAAREGIKLGKDVADALEADEETGNEINDLVIAQLPKYELMDHKFEGEITVGKVEIPFLMKIDSAAEDLSAFYEYKTGLTAWSQKKAEEHGQIGFYSTGCCAITGKIPKSKLIYAPSERTNGGLRLNGEIIEFETTKNFKDILKFKIRIKNAWLKIQELTERELI